MRQRCSCQTAATPRSDSRRTQRTPDRPNNVFPTSAEYPRLQRLNDRRNRRTTLVARPSAFCCATSWAKAAISAQVRSMVKAGVLANTASPIAPTTRTLNCLGIVLSARGPGDDTRLCGGTSCVPGRPAKFPSRWSRRPERECAGNYGQRRVSKLVRSHPRKEGSPALKDVSGCRLTLISGFGISGRLRLRPCGS